MARIWPELATIGLVALLATGCSRTPEARRPISWLGAPIDLGPKEPGAETRQVILVTIDGVRWQEVFHGTDPALAAEAGLPPKRMLSAAQLLPNIHRHFFEGGVAIGAPLASRGIFASGPNYVSLPGYLEILQGRTVPECEANDCPPVRAPTLLDEIRSLPDASRKDVAAFTSWHECSRAASGDPGRVVLSTGRKRGSVSDLAWLDRHCDRLLSQGRQLSPEPGTSEYRPDRATSEIALCYLVAARPKLLWVGLGDTDEHAHREDYAAYLDALRRADAFMGTLFERLAEMGDYGRTTTVIVTTDHGRGPRFQDHGRDQTASRVFLLAAGGAVPRRGPLPSERAYRLSDVAPTIRALLGLD